MDEKELKELMKIGKDVNFNDLKDVVRDINDAIDLFNGEDNERVDIGKIRVVGLKKPNMFVKWVEAVETMGDSEFDGLPGSSVEFYNKHVNPPEEEEQTEKTDPVEGEGDGEGVTEKDKKAPKKAKGAMANRPTSFEDLKKRLKNPSAPTPYFDSMTLAGGTLEDLLAKFKKYLADTGLEFKSLNTLSAIKRHITYRQTTGWLYEEDGDKIKLVGYSR